MKGIEVGNDNKIITIDKNNYNQNELAILISDSTGAINVSDGNSYKTINREEIYYINPSQYTIQLLVKKDNVKEYTGSISPKLISTGLGGYGLNLI